MNAESPGSAYRLFSLLLFPFWLLHAFWHGRSQGVANYFKLRLFGSRRRIDKSKIWIHAASVGEVIAITPLVKRLINESEAILFSSFTATGLQTIRRQFSNEVESCVIPIDFLPCCWFFLRRHQIKLCLLMETELWPELIYQTTRRNIPVVQVNARLSKKTTEAPVFIRYLLRRTLSNIRLHLARSEQDRQLLMGLGADPENIKIIGNLKSRLDTGEEYDNLIKHDYLLLASSHDGEETLFVEHRLDSQPLIVIAPRHPKRSQSIQKALAETDIRFAVRSKHETIDSDTEVYLADTLGELKALMAHAQLVVMGGSFDQTGGHNLLEPANLGCPIITGPSDSNIVADIKLLSDSIFQVRDMPACWQKIQFLMDNPQASLAMRVKVRQIVEQQDDMLSDYFNEIRAFLV